MAEGQEGIGGLKNKEGGLGRLGGIGKRLRKLTEDRWFGFLRGVAEGKEEAVNTLVGGTKKEQKGGDKNGDTKHG